MASIQIQKTEEHKAIPLIMQPLTNNCQKPATEQKAIPLIQPLTEKGQNVTNTHKNEHSSFGDKVKDAVHSVVNKIHPHTHKTNKVHMKKKKNLNKEGNCDSGTSSSSSDSSSESESDNETHKNKTNANGTAIIKKKAVITTIETSKKKI